MNERELAELHRAVAGVEGIAVELHVDRKGSDRSGPECHDMRVVSFDDKKRKSLGAPYAPGLDMGAAMRLVEKYKLTIYPQMDVAQTPHKLMHWVAVTELGRQRETRTGFTDDNLCVAVCKAVASLSGAHLTHRRRHQAESKHEDPMTAA